MSAIVLFTTVIHHVRVAIIQAQGQRWLSARDLAAVLGYKSESGIRLAYSRHQRDPRLSGHSIKAKVSGYGGSDARLFDEIAIGYFCEYTKRAGAFHLLRWLEEGGMQLDEQLPLPGVQEITLEEIELTAVEEQPKAPILALVPSKLPPVPSDQQERAKAYCRELLKTLLRYANDEEIDHLVHVVEASVLGVLNVRYCQGLNDARYELYRRFWLQGGAK